MNIQIENLTKTYGRVGRSVTALHDVQLEIREGMFGLLGPNGAGKTSLMRILAGLARPSAGRVLIQGNDINTAEGLLAV